MNERERFLSSLREIGAFRLNEPVHRHVTFGVGGPADIYFPADTETQLLGAYSLARRHGIPVFIFGSGSNVLVGDGGIRGLTIENRTEGVEGPERNGTGFRVRVASGVSFAALARKLSLAGYEGVEWACGIPGSLGGAVMTNAGAYGRSLSDVLRSVRVGDERGRITELSAEDLQLGYRRSAFTRGRMPHAVVLSLDLRLDQGDPRELKALVRRLDEQRKAAQPPGRNCGSVFKNPPGEHPGWWYVDEAGLRGRRIGNAQISEKHANFIQNLGGATAADIKSLIEMAQARVREQFGVELETEVIFVGEFR